MNTSGIPKKVTQQAQRSKEGFSTGCRRILTTLMECDRPVLIPADEAFPLARGWEKGEKPDTIRRGLMRVFWSYQGCFHRLARVMPEISCR